MKYQHIIWDWNGTLIDDAWLSVEVLNELLARRGLPSIDAAQYQRAFDFPVVNLYHRIGFDLAQVPFETLSMEFVTLYDRRRFECRLQREAREVLQSLAARGYAQSILSASEQRRLEEFVAFAGLQGVFTRLVGLRDYYAAGKVDHGRRLIAEIDCSPAAVLLVGDTVHDYEVATAMGADCVLVPSGHHTYEKLSTCGVPVLGSLAELLEVVENETG